MCGLEDGGSNNGGSFSRKSSLSADTSPERLSQHICRKFDRRLLPIITGLYLISYLDRGNIGNAKTAGAQADLGLGDTQWTWVLDTFYLVYTCMEWTILLWKVLPAHIYVCFLCLGWGAAAMCSGAVTSYGGLLACRAVLGLCEAAFGAGAVYYCSLFYTRKELGTRLSIVLGTAPLANCFASALAYGLTHTRGSIAPWRLLFVVEGAPAILVIPVVFFLLPDSPSSTHYLAEDQRTFAVERLQAVDHTAKSKIAWSQVTAGLGDWKNWAHAAIHFSFNYSFSGLSNFLPTIVASMGFSSINAQGVTAPVYLAAFLLNILVAWWSDRIGQRGWFICVSSCVGFVGYLLLAAVHDEDNIGARYTGVWLAACGVFPAFTLNVTWMFSNQGGDTKKGVGFVILTTLGQCSSFVSSSVFPSSEGPLYVRGSAIGCALTGLVIPVSLALHFALARENRRRDREYGRGNGQEVIDVTNRGDRDESFRYLT